MAASPKFKPYTISEFEAFIESVSVKRAINHIQIHHTWRPRKTDYRGEVTIVGMWRYHTETRGWSDIGQHFSIAPDGVIWDGRSLELDPAGISGHNSGGIMFEMIGNFDKGEERLEGIQLDAIITAIRVLMDKFNLELSDIVFHREFSSKTCPGSGISKDWFLEQSKNRKKIETSIDTSLITYDSAPEWQQPVIDWLYQEGYLSAEEWKGNVEAGLPLWAEAIVLQRIYNSLMDNEPNSSK